MAILPELILLTGAFAFFVLSLFRQLDQVQLKNTAVCFGFLTFLGALISVRSEATLFFGSYQVDFYSQLFKLMIGFGLAVAMVFGRHLKDVDESIRPEYFMFLFLSTLGLTLLVSAVELVTIFISLELSSFAIYLLVPMRSDARGRRFQMEAGIKYILFGVMATGFMLFGMSYLFGLTGTTYLNEIVAGLRNAPEAAVVFAVVMVMAGFFFKMAVFPMHFWVPDVYQGAANETSGFIATVPKLAAVALLIRIISLSSDSTTIIYLLMFLALCSMFYGNLSALVQTDIKRMLGFSGIAHAGFIMLGLLTMDPAGYGIAIYYICGYVMMNMACFLVICNVSREGENLAIEDLKGLHKRQPVLALILALSLFALGGIPPFVGFMGKFMLLTGTLQAGGTENLIYLIVVILAAVNTAIAIFYYLSVVKAAYTSDADEELPPITVDGLNQAVGIGLVVLMLIMGSLPDTFVALADSAVKTMLLP